jgi:hypothetical protein
MMLVVMSVTWNTPSEALEFITRSVELLVFCLSLFHSLKVKSEMIYTDCIYI